MKLYVSTMDAILVEFQPDGRVRFNGEDWTAPTLQERRAILYAAKDQLADLRELIEALEQETPISRP